MTKNYDENVSDCNYIRKINWKHVQKKYKWTACLLNSFSKKEVLNFLSLIATHYTNADQRYEDYFYWEYMDNPSGPAIIFVAKCKDEIIGEFIANPMRFNIKGVLRRGVLGTRAVVRDDFTSKGVYPYLAYKTLCTSASRGIDFMYGFPIKRVQKTLIEKLDFSKVREFPLLLKPLNIKNILKVRLKSKTWIKNISIFLFLPLKILGLGEFIRYRQKKIIIRETNFFDERFDIFWEKVKNQYKNIMIRDSRFLNWRYVYNPRKKYKIFYATDLTGNIIAYIVLGISKFKKLNTGYIMDILGEENKIGSRASSLLIKKALSYFRKNSVDTAGCIMLSNKSYFKRLLMNGFLVCPSKFKPYPLKPVIKIIRNSGKLKHLLWGPNWYITLGDFDAV